MRSLVPPTRSVEQSSGQLQQQFPQQGPFSQPQIQAGQSQQQLSFWVRSVVISFLLIEGLRSIAVRMDPSPDPSSKW